MPDPLSVGVSIPLTQVVTTAGISSVYFKGIFYIAWIGGGSQINVGRVPSISDPANNPMTQSDVIQIGTSSGPPSLVTTGDRLFVAWLDGNNGNAGKLTEIIDPTRGPAN